MVMTRRQLLATTGALALPFGAANSLAQSAEFTLKFGSNLPATHPICAMTRALSSSASVSGRFSGCNAAARTRSIHGFTTFQLRNFSGLQSE